jgi:hypothetical protein
MREEIYGEIHYTWHLHPKTQEQEWQEIVGKALARAPNQGQTAEPSPVPQVVTGDNEHKTYTSLTSKQSLSQTLGYKYML